MPRGAGVLKAAGRRVERRHAAGEGVTGHLPLEWVAAHESSGEGKAFPLEDQL